MDCSLRESPWGPVKNAGSWTPPRRITVSGDETELRVPRLPMWFQCTSKSEAFEAKHSRQRVWGTCHTVWPEMTCRLLFTPTLQIGEFDASLTNVQKACGSEDDLDPFPDLSNLWARRIEGRCLDQGSPVPGRTCGFHQQTGAKGSGNSANGRKNRKGLFL